MNERITKLCDGDCGNVYEEKYLNRTCYGDDFCNDCMCDFIREQDHLCYKCTIF